MNGRFNEDKLLSPLDTYKIIRHNFSILQLDGDIANKREHMTNLESIALCCWPRNGGEI